jgi:hypothetical protein
VRLLTCRPRKRVQTWRKLERAFLLVFRELHGNDIPYLNKQGKEITERGEFDIFSKERIRTLIRELEDTSMRRARSGSGTR